MLVKCCRPCPWITAIDRLRLWRRARNGHFVRIRPRMQTSAQDTRCLSSLLCVSAVTQDWDCETCYALLPYRCTEGPDCSVMARISNEYARCRLLIADDSGREMGANDDRMMKAVQSYPCPWCSEKSGYSLGVASFSDWLNASARSLAVIAIKRTKALEVFLSPGMAATCLNCRKTIGICGHCDHPNRGAGFDFMCQTCGKTYRPG